MGTLTPEEREILRLWTIIRRLQQGDPVTNDLKLHGIIEAVFEEAARAASKHPPMHSHHEAHSVIQEEFDEYWDLVKLNPKKPMVHPTKDYPLTPETRLQELREELIQTAAMCVRTLHDLC